VSVWTWVAMLVGWTSLGLALAACCGLAIRAADRRRIHPDDTTPGELDGLGDFPSTPEPPAPLRGRPGWARAVTRSQRPARRRGRRPAPHGLR
jgi:hypothetical protein